MTMYRKLLLAALGAGPFQRTGAGRSPARCEAGVPGRAAGPHDAASMLERRVLPSMGGADYLGPEINGDSYRLKFIQNGRVVWVDVDGQGRISAAPRTAGR